MTVSSTVRRNDYASSGITGPYAYTFRIFDATDLRVSKVDASGTETVLTYATDYTVSNVGNRNGGSVTLATAIPSGYTIIVQRVRPFTQETDFRNQGPFFAETHEDALDHLTMIAQLLRDQITPTFRAPSTVNPASLNLEIPGLTPNSYLRVNNGGTGLEAVASVIASQNFLQSGTGATTRTMNAKAAEVLSVTDFGAACDGVTDDYAAVLRALTAAKASTGSRHVYIPGICFIGTPFVLDSSFAGVSIWGRGGDRSGFIRGFNGALFTLTAALNFEWHHLYFDGRYGTNTGKCLVMAGNCNYPVISHCRFLGFSDAHVEFGADCGYNARCVANQHFSGAGQSDYLVYHVTGQDTTATPRNFASCLANGYFKFEGAFDTQVIGCFATRYVFDNNCSESLVTGSIWADQVNFLADIPISIGGLTTCVTGCRIANSVILISGSSGAFTGNKQSGVLSGLEPLNDQSGGTWQVLHQALGKTYTYLGLSKLNSVAPGEILSLNHVAQGDADATVTFHTNNSFGYHTPLTAHRTLTVDLTDARPNQLLHVHRDGGDTGGPWHVRVQSTNNPGSPGTFTVKDVLTGQWFDFLYNGSYVEVMRSAALL